MNLILKSFEEAGRGPKIQAARVDFVCGQAVTV
jgi:hypothetical protein